MGNQTQGPPPPAPPLGARKRLVRKASASAGQAELGRSPARRNPKQQGPATALAEEEEDWDLDAPPRKRAQWGSGPRAGMKSSAAPRASKRSHFKGVTLKNKRSALAPCNACSGEQVVVQRSFLLNCAATHSAVSCATCCVQQQAAFSSFHRAAWNAFLYVSYLKLSPPNVTSKHHCSFMWCLLALQNCCDAVEWGTEAAHPPGLLALLPGCSPYQ